jgi:hypothetical protein
MVLEIFRSYDVVEVLLMVGTWCVLALCGDTVLERLRALAHLSQRHDTGSRA